jgi:large subunit ribosomal protein L9
MKVYLLKDIENVGMKGEIIKVTEGYAQNFLFPRKLAFLVTSENEAFYAQRAKTLENRKEVISSKTSMLAQKMNGMKLTLKRKMHDDGKLYAAVNPSEIADLLSLEGFAVGKSQIKIHKSIKEKGNFDVVVKLTSQLQPTIQIKIVSENSAN